MKTSKHKLTTTLTLKFIIASQDQLDALRRALVDANVQKSIIGFDCKTVREEPTYTWKDTAQFFYSLLHKANQDTVLTEEPSLFTSSENEQNIIFDDDFVSDKENIGEECINEDLTEEVEENDN